MQDLAHSLHCKWRSTAHLQSLVLEGKYGNTPGRLKPLDNLKVQELRQELRARGHSTIGLKAELQRDLEGILKGVQRVPTLLVLNLHQSLSALNLSQYETLDCEPLHDLKGHIGHLLDEIPYLLPSTLKPQCDLIIEATVPKQKVSGACFRVALLKIYLWLLSSEGVDRKVIMLVQSAVNMSKLLYLPDSSRTPKAILNLHNSTWLHHELCQELITNRHGQTLQRLFGVYLHDLMVHAPRQYELVCLRSTNSENQERLFSQLKHISLRATNRKTENVLPTILLSMQAKQKTLTQTDCLKHQDTMVSTVSAKLPKFKGTTISNKSFSSPAPSQLASPSIEN